MHYCNEEFWALTQVKTLNTVVVLLCIILQISASEETQENFHVPMIQGFIPHDKTINP